MENSIIKPRTSTGVSHQWCVAIGCSSDSRKRGRYGYMAGIEFYPFPSKTKNQKLRKKWLEHLKRDEYETKASHSICSKHFIDGKPTEKHPIPTLFAFNNFGMMQTTRSTTAIVKRETPSKFKTKCTTSNNSAAAATPKDCTVDENYNVLCDEELNTVFAPLPSKEVTVLTENVNLANVDLQCYESLDTSIETEKKTVQDHCYFKQDKIIPDPDEKSIQTDFTHTDFDEYMNKSQKEIRDLKSTLEDKDNLLRTLFVQKVLKNDKSVKQFTGVPSKAILDGLFDLITPDEIMADRGFTIKDLLTERKATLNIPPFTRKCPWGKGRRLNSLEVKKTKAIAKQRIHVERAIGRLKNFKMLANTLRLKYKPVASQMLKVSGFLCNLGPPLVKK